MAKRGRSSAAEQAVAPYADAPVARIERLTAPVSLTDPQRDVWEAVIASHPAEWFNSSHVPILTAYCAHTVHARVLDEKISAFDVEWTEADGGLERLALLFAMRDRETRAITACARSMRITQQATIRPETGGRKMANNPGTGRRPWQDG